MKILIRFDDFCPTMDYEQWYRAYDVLRKYNVKPLIGVVPDCHDPELAIDDYHEDFWDYVKQLQNEGYTFAMHGDTHVYYNLRENNGKKEQKSEFAGLPYEQQIAKIKHGIQKLNEHDIKTDVFFAPSHSYDDNTLKALSVCGFKYLSDGKSLKPIIRHGIVCLPCRDGGKRSILRSDYQTLVFHPSEWTRADKADGYERLQNVCKKYCDQIVDFNEYAKQPLGNYFVQSIDGVLYSIWDKYVANIVRKLLFR